MLRVGLQVLFFCGSLQGLLVSRHLLRAHQHCLVRFLMTEAKLCLFPVLGGCSRMCLPKFNRADQEEISLGLAVILCSNFDSIFPQAGRADLGMCFIVDALSRG